MAAAEARTAWQRTANRCFVQEDAKRAPKLACCSSSCAQQYEQGNIHPTNGPDHPAPNFIPLNWYPTHSNLPPDTKWWLQLQPNFGYQKDLTCDQLNCLEDELDEPKSERTNPALNQLEPHLGGPTNTESRKNDYPSESPRMISTAFMKNESIKRGEDVKTKTSNSQQTLKHKVDMDDYFYHDAELMDWKSEKTSFDMEAPWAGGNKCEPWWRVVDKDELASLVAQKSQQHIENCDLPKPSQTSKDPFACLESLDGSRIFSASGGRKLHSGMCNPIEYAPHSSTSGSFDEKHWYSSDSSHYTEKLASATHAPATTPTDPPENRPAAKNDPSRAQLLEALRHSQTRAREAEMAAEKAYNEKEHIVKLLFRQASHLFAYKQWLHMLQLESLYHQFTSKDGRTPILFPSLPWTPLKGKPSRKGKKHKKCRFCRYAVAFAVGLGLAGAGLLLGWTLGWLLPAF